MVGLIFGVEVEKSKVIVASDETRDGTAVIEINIEEVEIGNDWRLFCKGVTSVAIVEEKPWFDTVVGIGRTEVLLTMLAIIEPLILATSVIIELLAMLVAVEDKGID